MKKSKGKYVFIIFIIIISIFGFVIIRQNSEEKAREEEYNAEAEKVNQINEIKLGIAELDSMNPLISKNKNVQDVSKLIYEPLVEITNDYKVTSCLAIEWAKQADNSYIIKLKENVKWSDGKKFTAQDVKFTIDTLKTIDSIYTYNVSYIESVNIVDDYTLKINLSKNISFFEYNLTFPILSKEYYEGQDFLSTEKNAKPVGTGMYKIAEVENSNIVLEKNTNWWNKEPELNLNKITINLYSSIGELYNSFKLGNVDVISTDNEDIQNYIGTIGYNPKYQNGRDHTFIALNTQNTMLASSEIRKAISYSIDIDSIISNVLGGTVNRSSFPLDYGSFLGMNGNSSSGYSIEQAKKILEENGWKLVNNKWQKYENYKTTQLTFNLLVKSSDSLKVAIAENIKAQLVNQGITVNISYAGDADYYAALNAKSYDMALTTLIMAPSPNLDTFFGSGNLANYTNEEVNTILQEVNNTKDENVLLEKYDRLFEIYNLDMPYISLYNNKHLVAYNSEVSGQVLGTWYNPFYGIETWYK